MLSFRQRKDAARVGRRTTAEAAAQGSLVWEVMPSRHRAAPSSSAPFSAPRGAPFLVRRRGAPRSAAGSCGALGNGFDGRLWTSPDEDKEKEITPAKNPNSEGIGFTWLILAVVYFPFNVTFFCSLYFMERILL